MRFGKWTAGHLVLYNLAEYLFKTDSKALKEPADGQTGGFFER